MQAYIIILYIHIYCMYISYKWPFRMLSDKICDSKIRIGVNHDAGVFKELIKLHLLHV